MKVIVLSSCYPRPSNVGNGIFVHQQVKALQSLGIECHIIQPVNWFPPLGLHRFHPYWRVGFQQFQDTFSEYEGVIIHHPRVFLKMPSRFYNDHSWDMEGEAVTRYIQSNMNLRDADLVYAQFLIHEGYVGAIVRKRTGIPLVSIALGDDVHAWPEKNPGIIPFLKKALYGADLLLANSRALAQDTENWADDAHPLRVQVMYQGIDLEKFQPLKESESLDRLRRKFGLETSDYYLLCVATPVKLKGWLNLLDSIRELGDQFIGWQFLMVAPKRESPDALDLEEEAERRGIGRSVKHLGKVDHTCMPDLMRAVDAFVLPSYNEGLSNAVLEAMASGTPVIATNVGGHREFIESGVNGILVQPNNTSQLKDALLKLVQDNKFRADIALQARTGAQTIGTYEENAIKLLEVFKSLLGQK